MLQFATDPSCDFSKIITIIYISFYTVSQKKQDTILLPITSPNVDRFSKFFTNRLSSKFAVNQSLNIPPHLNSVATLPCEILSFRMLFFTKNAVMKSSCGLFMPN